MFGIEEQSIFANLCSDYSLSVCKQLLQIVHLKYDIGKFGVLCREFVCFCAMNVLNLT